MEHEIRFPNTFWDDFPFNVSVVRNVERVTVTSKQYYHFLRARTESETAAYRRLSCSCHAVRSGISGTAGR